MILGKTLAAINPDVLQSVANAASETLGCYDKPVIEPPGLFSLLSQFRHKELRRSIAFINRFLEKLENQIKVRGACKWTTPPALPEASSLIRNAAKSLVFVNFSR